MGYNWYYVKMKKFILIVVGIIMCISVVSCNTPHLMTDNEMTEVFKGKTKAEIIEIMGEPPIREVSDGGNGSIIVYELGEKRETSTRSNQSHTYFYTENSSSITVICFFLNSNGICRKATQRFH